MIDRVFMITLELFSVLAVFFGASLGLAIIVTLVVDAFTGPKKP